MIKIPEGNDFLLRTHVNIKADEGGGWEAYPLMSASDVKIHLIRDDRPAERIPLAISSIVGDFVGTDVDGGKLRPGKHGVEVTFIKANGRKGRVFRRSLFEIVHCSEEASANTGVIEADVCIYVNLDVESIDIGKDTVDQALRDQVAQNTIDIAGKANSDSVDEDLTNLEIIELLGLNIE